MIQLTGSHTKSKIIDKPYFSRKIFIGHIIFWQNLILASTFSATRILADNILGDIISVDCL